MLVNYLDRGVMCPAKPYSPVICKNLCRSANGTYLKRRAEGARVELARQLRSLRLEWSAVAHRLALPHNKAPAVGFEPTVVSLTGRRLTNLATPEYSSQDGRI